MSKFEQIKILYNQFLNLADEITSLINTDEYNEAISKLNYKDSLLEQLGLLKKNSSFTQEESEELKEIEKELVAKESANIALLSQLKEDVAQELKGINKKHKVNSAYLIRQKENNGTMIDYTE